MNSLKSQDISNISIVAFILNVWISENVFSAFFLVLTEKLSEKENSQILKVLSEGVFWEVIFYVTCVGLILSLPTLLILALIMKTLTVTR